MIIYKDALAEAQDELLTDSYKVEEIDKILLRVKGKMKTETNDIDDRMIGGNASAEGGCDEGVDSASTTGINVVLAHRLVDFDIKKKEYMTHIKGYMAKVKARIEKVCPEDKDIFVANSAKFVKELVSNFKDWSFYCGESMDPDGMLVMCKWVTNETTKEDEPFLYYFKHGLDAEKV